MLGVLGLDGRTARLRTTLTALTLTSQYQANPLNEVDDLDQRRIDILSRLRWSGRRYCKR